MPKNVAFKFLYISEELFNEFNVELKLSELVLLINTTKIQILCSLY